MLGRVGECQIVEVDEEMVGRAREVGCLKTNGIYPASRLAARIRRSRILMVPQPSVG